MTEGGVQKEGGGGGWVEGEPDHKEEAPDPNAPFHPLNDPVKSGVVSVTTGSSTTDMATVRNFIRTAVQEEAAPMTVAAVMEGEHLLKPVTPGAKVGSGTGMGIAVLGMYNGTTEFFEARHKGDVKGEVLSATDASVGALNFGIQTAKFMGHEASPLLEGSAKVGGTVVLVAQAAKNIYDAKGTFLDRDINGNVTGLGNKGEITVKEGAKVGTGIAIATATTATVGTAGLAAVAAPVVLAGVAVYAVDKTADAAIAANNAWKEVDHQIEEGGQARRLGPLPSTGVAINDDRDRPDARRYAHIIPEAIRVSADIPDSKIVGGTLERKDGRILPTPANAKILSDPQNLPVIEAALQTKVQKETQVMKDNDQMLPIILRWTDSSMDKTEKYTLAKGELLNSKGALQEIQMYRQDLAAYDAAHPQQQQPSNSAGNAFAKVAPPPSPSPADIKVVQTELASRGLYGGPVNGQWNQDVNRGLNMLMYTAQNDGKTEGTYNGNIDLRYGTGTAGSMAAGISSNSPNAVSPQFLAAMNSMYKNGALQTVYRSEKPELVAARLEPLTVTAKADEVKPEVAPIVAEIKQPLVTAPATSPTETAPDTRATGSYASTIDDKNNFNVASITPTFTAAANGQTPQGPAPAPILVAQQTAKPVVPAA